MTVTDISEVLRNAPRNCWLALNDEQSEVVAYGDTPDAAIDAAEAKGIKDPVLFWSPTEWIPAVF
jgi:hypothetical protein